jgi:hypothetical protein
MGRGNRAANQVGTTVVALRPMPPKKTPTKNTQSKSDFIRSQPAAVSAADVVAKGKAAGIRFSTQLVYNVRAGSRGKQVAAKKTSTPKPVSVAKAKSKVSKADFVRARSHLSPKEIVEDAKTDGLKLGVAYVYNVRGYDKTKGKKKSTKAAAAPTARPSPTTVKPTTRPRVTPTTPVARPIANRSSAEDLLKAMAAEIGLGRAIELLQGERARVHSILRG